MQTVSRINLDNLPVGHHKLFFHILDDTLGNDISIPVIIIKSKKKGPLVCANALIHGDELNGMEVIHKTIEKINGDLIAGTFLAIPVFNVPGFLSGQRHFLSGIDLNHIMPGKPKGKVYEVYVNKIITKLLSNANYHLDLHTARSGSKNSYYLRADMSNPKIEEMAKCLNASIILDHIPTPTTLRGSLAGLGIPSITFEIGDPLRYQKNIVDVCSDGILRFLESIKMVKPSDRLRHQNPLLCKDSIKLAVEEGGIIEVFPELLSKVKAGDVLAVLKDVFGHEKEKIVSPIDGIVIGKINNPVISEGTNFIHIGSKNKLFEDKIEKV